MDQVKQEENHAKDQAIAQIASIREMVARLDHTCVDENCDTTLERGSNPDLTHEEYHDTEAAREAIEEDPLSVQVRSAWLAPGDWGNKEQGSPAEFEILLCTGGPAVRLVGDLDEYARPSRVWVEYQDWGTPWTEYYPGSSALEDVLTYAQQFYFGE
jgi:hypothetical protein